MNMQEIFEVSKYSEIENFQDISKKLDTNIVEAIYETKEELQKPNEE